MKKLFTFLTSILISALIMAQSPYMFSYQALVRDDSGQLIKEESIGVQISILQGSQDGAAVYVETHTVVSNLNGLVTLAVGAGSTSDNFSAIDWSAGPYFLKTEMDPTGGINYSISGTTQLLSVPFALHAETAGNGFSGDYGDLTNAPDLSIFATKDMNNQRITNLGHPVEEHDAVNRAFVTMSVSFTGDTLFLGNAQYVIIPGISAANHDDGMTVTDIDGNTYSIILIGDQAWLGEDLKTTRLNDGTLIPYISDHAEWFGMTTPAHCFYDNDEAWKDIYGTLYNWHTVETGILCPEGWAVPHGTDFMELVELLGGYEIAGGKLKSTRTAPDYDHPRWDVGNVGATDLYGFSALPTGRRWEEGFENLGTGAFYWSSHEGDSPLSAHFFFIVFDHEFGSMFPFATTRTVGKSIRCIKVE